MAEIETTYTLRFDEEEVLALKKLLGAMNDDDFAQYGIQGVERERMHDLWVVLPDIGSE